MSAERHFLAFDCGATSGRGMLATFDGASFRMEEVYRFPSRILREGGGMYWDISQLEGHLRACLKEVGRRGIRLESIGIDTWGVDFGCIGKSGEVLGNPRCYRDPYTKDIPQAVYRQIPREELYARTGIQILPFNTVFQLYAQARAGEKALAEAECILFMPDLLSYLLTGRKVCEYTDASTSGMMDQTTRQFDKPLLEELGIPTGVLLPIVPSGTVIGPLKEEIARESGLGPVKVVAVAGHDTASAIAAVPAGDERFAYLSSGTWSLMGIETAAPIINDESSRLNFTNEGGIEGTTRFLKNITGMWLLEECRRIWKASGKDYSYSDLAAMAQAEKDFPGRIHPDDPRFAAPEDMVEEILRSAQDDKDATLNGKDVILNEVKNLSDAQIVSCIYHSLADRYKEVLGMLQEFAPFPIEKLHIIGGGSQNDLLNQWTADAVGIPVIAGPAEATAIGNVMLQAKAAGLVADRWQMRRLITETFPVKTFTPYSL